jgi:protein-disulfide isomerase
MDNHEQTTPEHTSKPSTKSNIGTLLLGGAIGAALTAALMGFGARPKLSDTVAVAATPAAQVAQVDSAVIREAARQGAATAIAEIEQRPARQGQEPAPAAAQEQPQPDPNRVFNVSTRPANTQGDPNAPVTIVEYSDFECGFCRRFNDSTLQQLVSDYVAKGVVKISYKHYPFLANSSQPKAMVSECASEQGKFWQMHDALFSGRIPAGDPQSIRNAAALAAKELGLDVVKFDACLDDENIKQRIIADATEAQQVGVRGTPTFLINGKVLVGAQPIDAFAIAIAQAQKQ